MRVAHHPPSLATSAAAAVGGGISSKRSRWCGSNHGTRRLIGGGGGTVTADAGVAVAATGDDLECFFFLFPALAPLATSLAVESGSEDGDDGEDVFREFLFVGDRRGVGIDDDGCAVLVEDVFNEIECESTKSVLVGDVDPSESSLEGKLEEVTKALALEVESACDVAEDSCIGVCDSEGGELSLEVGCLLAGTDSSVDDIDAVFLFHMSFKDSCFVFGGGAADPRGG